MNLYYHSLIQEIEELMNQDQYKEALNMINQELMLPYIPLEAEETLKQMKRECLPHLRPNAPVPDFQKIQSWIYGTSEQKEKAVHFMRSLNLRQYEDLLQYLLDSDLSSIGKGELIEAMMEQKLDHPFHIKKDGLDITFIPSTILSSKSDAGVIQCIQYLEDWFLNENPTMLTLALSLLEQEILVSRPFDFQETEGKQLAKSIAKAVFDSMCDKEEAETFFKEKGLNNVPVFTLSIEK